MGCQYGKLRRIKTWFKKDILINNDNDVLTTGFSEYLRKVIMEEKIKKINYRKNLVGLLYFNRLIKKIIRRHVPNLYDIEIIETNTDNFSEDSSGYYYKLFLKIRDEQQVAIWFGISYGEEDEDWSEGIVLHVARGWTDKDVYKKISDIIREAYKSTGYRIYQERNAVAVYLTDGDYKTFLNENTTVEEQSKILKNFFTTFNEKVIKTFT